MHVSTSLLIIISLHAIAGQWIDPHSMDTKLKSKLPNNSEDISKQSSQKCVHVTPKECTSNIHMRRIVRLILNNAYLNSDFGYHEGHINIKLSASEHKFLLDFSQNDRSEESIFSEVSSIFENALQKPASDRYPELILSVQEKIYDLIFNPISMALFGACLALFMTYRLLKAQFTWKSIVKYFLFLAYITDFAVTYINIVQEEEIETMVNLKKLGSVPPECDPKKMSWWDFIKTQLESTFVENPCKAYYQATYQKYLHIIAPSKIFTRQFRTIIVEPFGDIGEGLGKFGRGMFTSLPWGLNFVIFPIMLLTTCVILFLIFLFITKPHFKISMFHLFTIELGRNVGDRGDGIPAIQNNESNRRQIEYTPNRARNRRSRNSGREVGVATNHRVLVEEVSNNNSSSHGDGQNMKKEEYQNDSKTKALEDDRKSDNSAVSDDSSFKSDE